MKRLIVLCLVFFGFFSNGLRAAPHGKIDVGAAYLEADIRLNSFLKVEAQMAGVSASGLICVCQDLGLNPFLDGLALKPRFLIAGGDGDAWNIGLGVGYVVPYRIFYIVPHVGVTYGEMDTHVTLPFLGKNSLVFESVSPYVGLDMTVCLGNSWQLTLIYEYAWPRTETIFQGSSLGKAESTGSNYAFQLEYLLTKMWSLHVAGTLNDSRDKEKIGIKIAGARVGAGVTF